MITAQQIPEPGTATRLGEFRFRVSGFGASLPSRRVDNEELAAQLGTDPEWIASRCGIHARHVAEHENSRTLGVAAARSALAMAPHCRPDLLICNTFTPEYRLCPTAPAIAHDLGIAPVGAFDLNAACSGGVLGILTSLSFLSSGVAKSVLLVSADTTTKYLDRNDRDTRILFGDGAAALLIEADAKDGSRMRSFSYGSDGTGATYFHVPSSLPEPSYSGSVCNRVVKSTPEATVSMNGRAMFRFAVEQGYNLMWRICSKAGVTFQQVDKVLVHQANLRIIHCLQERTSIPAERWIINIDHVGNLAGASIPVALVDCLSKRGFGSGELVLVAAFGAGLTWAGLLAQW